MDWIVGIDEAGRGPLAGPVAVGVVMVPAHFDIRAEFPGVTDSKKLSEKKRENIFLAMHRRASAGDLQFSVNFTSAEDIDDFGIVVAIRQALDQGLLDLVADPSLVHVLLDGSLHALAVYSQETIIGGDLTEPVISLASIAAKVLRDHEMLSAAKKYPEYGFEQHKGYGTKAHYAAIQKHGLSPLHRRSFGLMTS